MLTQHRLFTAHQAEGIFQIRAETQHRRNIFKARRQSQRIRHIPPRTAQHFAAFAHHRIIHPLHDVAVMYQKSVGNALQIRQRLFVADSWWFTAQVAGGHHQRALQFL